MTGFAIAMIGLVLGQPLIWLFERAMSNTNLDDPIYKKNVQKLIERNRRFEESKE